MFRVEVLQTWFFLLPELRKDGKIIPAPIEAVSKYCELKREWMIPHEELPHEIPKVSLSPNQDPKRVGYVVRTEIIYK